MKYSSLPISVFILFIIVSCQQQRSPLKTGSIHPDLVQMVDSQLTPFYHGVASGDPTKESVIIWTRISADASLDSLELTYFISESQVENAEIISGKVLALNANDYTVKEDVQGLKPGTSYTYHFEYQDYKSPTGQTKTLPDNVSSFQIAFASCANFEWGYFGNYYHMGNDPSIDLVIHLGDYIYEYAPGVYGASNLPRTHVPASELLSLEDYRTRYSQYRLDKDLQTMHRMKPMIGSWDDHEIANNAYVAGAQNHQENEGDYSVRREAARKAYYEWMPIREGSHYRAFQVGNLVNISMLDSRLEGRSKQADSLTDPVIADSSRTLLGEEQFKWLCNNLSQPTKWHIIGNQVPFGPLNWQLGFKSVKGYMDGWDGYPYEQQKLDQFIRTNDIKNVVFVTGDFHRSFALENNLYANENMPNTSVEFVVTSITSSNDDEYYALDTAKLIQQLYLDNNPGMKFNNTMSHGYLVLNIMESHIEAQYHYIEDVRTKNASINEIVKLEVRTDDPTIHLIPN